MSSKKQNEKTLTAGEIRTYLLRALRLNESADKGVAMRFILANLLMSVQGYVNIYLIKSITDAIAVGKPLRATLIAVALMVGVCFMLYGIRVIIDRRRKCHELKRRQGLTDLLNNKAMEMDYVHLENPEMQTKFNRCKKSMLGSYSVLYVPDYLGYFIVNIFQVIASALLIFPYALTQTDKHGFGGFICSPWGFTAAALICFLFEMIKVFINDKANRIYEETQRDKGMIANERLYNEYLAHTIRHYQSGKDIRLYNEQEMILREVERTSKESIAIWKKAFVKFCSVDNFRQLASLMSLFTMYSYSILKALYGGLSAGEVIAFVMLFSSLSYSVTSVFDSISYFRIAAVNAKEVADFLDIPDEKYKGTIPTEKRDDNEYEFEFRHVYFKYPGSEEYVLKDVNLKWRIGEKMALVGKNGCGKSTLVKLL